MNKYNIILKVYETGNITKAAEALNYSQSAVSQMIHNYEKELGFPIFIRSKSGVSPTSEGSQIIESIRRILLEEKQIQEYSSNIRELHSGTIRVGSFTSVSILWLPQLMKSFGELYPNIHFEVVSGNYQDLTDMLKKGSINCSFLSATAASDLHFIPLYRDEYVVVCPTNHPFSQMASIPISLLANETFIMPGEGTGSELGAIFSQNNIRLTQCKYVSTDDAILFAMVENHLGITLLPRLVVDSMNAHVCVRPLKEHYFRSLGIAYNDIRYTSKATLKFLEFIKVWAQTLK